MRRVGLRERMMLSILIVAAVCSLGVTIVNYVQNEKWREERYVQQVDSIASLQIDTFDDVMRDLYLKTVSTGNSEKLYSCIAEYQNSEHTYEDEMKVCNTLKELLDVSMYNEALYLYITESETMFSTVDYYAVQKLDRSNMLLWSKSNEQPFSPLFYMNYLIGSPDYVWGYSYPIYNTSGEEIAKIGLTIDERKVYSNLLEPLNNNNNGESYYFVTEKGIICSSKKTGQIGHKVAGLPAQQTDRMMAQTNEEGLLQIRVEGGFTGYTILCECDRKNLTQELKNMYYLSVTTTGIIFLILIMVSVHISGKVYEPIEKLTTTMYEIEKGDFTARVPKTEQDDELSIVGRSFNKLMDHMDELMNNIVQERTQKRQAEINALQYQIRPHFMYNTLNSIRFAAVLENNQKLANLLGDFIELLEASIQRKGAFITMKEEIELVQNFLSLQAFRYSECFETAIFVEPEAEDCYVPCLLLQPMVENAVFHGIDTTKNDNVLEIDVWIDEDKLYISVCDNGAGFERSDNESRRLTGIGMNNVRDRLKLYYGDKADFIVNSQEGVGTTVEFCLPVSRDPEEYSIGKEHSRV